MSGHKLGRVTEDIKRELTDILKQVKDPRVQGMLSIVKVEVTNDLSYVNVYVSALEGIDTAKEAVKGLKSGSGYIRRELGQRISLRHVPQPIFHATDAIEYSANINKILESLRSDADAPTADQDG